MNIAVILAGGTGVRVGAKVPKQFIEVLGRPVISYTLDIYQSHPEIDAVEIVCHADWVGNVERIVSDEGFDKVRWICTGGSTFQESTMNGIFHLKGKVDPQDIVAVTFAAAPLTPPDDISDSIRVCKLRGNAISSKDIDLCTCIKDDEESTTQNILRETMKGFASPWTFVFEDVLCAYEEALARGMLDGLEPHTTSLYFALGKRLWFSQCTTPQVKITDSADLDTFEGHLLLRQKRTQLADNAASM